MVNRKLVDTNTLIYFLFSSFGEMHEKAVKALSKSEEIEITTIVVAELVYFLKKEFKTIFTNFGENESKKVRQRINITVSTLLNEFFCTDKKLILLALKLMEEHSLDFVDCLLLAKYKIEHKEIISFDKKLVKICVQLSNARQIVNRIVNGELTEDEWLDGNLKNGLQQNNNQINE